MSRARRSLGVEWTLPGRKRPFATTTQATSDLIVALAEEGGTVCEVRDRIHFDPEAVAVLDYLCDHGLANTPADTIIA